MCFRLEQFFVCCPYRRTCYTTNWVYTRETPVERVARNETRNLALELANQLFSGRPAVILQPNKFHRRAFYTIRRKKYYTRATRFPNEPAACVCVLGCWPPFFLCVPPPPNSPGGFFFSLDKKENTGQIENNNGSATVLNVGRNKRMESFLSCGIPYLKTYNIFPYVNVFRHERCTNCGSNSFILI